MTAPKQQAQGGDPQAPLAETPRSLLVAGPRAAELREAALHWPSCSLAASQLSDLEMLLDGALHPLGGFLGRGDYESVVRARVLADGRFWPHALALETGPEHAGLPTRSRLALRDAEGVMLAVLHVSEVWTDPRGRILAGGAVEGVSLPTHHDFHDLRLGVERVRGRLGDRPGRVLAVFPGLAIHRGLERAVSEAARALDAGVLVLAPVGAPRLDRLDYFGRVAGLRAAVAAWDGSPPLLTLVPLEPTDRPDTAEWLLRGVVARNYGATHVALPPRAPTALTESLGALAREVGVDWVVLASQAFDRRRATMVDLGETPSSPDLVEVDDPALGRAIASGRPVPNWLLAPGAAEALTSAFPPREKQGFTVFFTGLSGSGKSTIANALRVRLLERLRRPVSFLDGDLVRRHLSSELGFSREHRDLNILRIGYVASEVTRHGGIAICAPIAPYAAIRERVRAMIEPVGGFVLVHVATPLEVCERRDRKGLYAKARAGLIPQFTGVSDPYETPTDAALTIDTRETTVSQAVDVVLRHLETAGYVPEERGR